MPQKPKRKLTKKVKQELALLFAILLLIPCVTAFSRHPLQKEDFMIHHVLGQVIHLRKTPYEVKQKVAKEKQQAKEEQEKKEATPKEIKEQLTTSWTNLLEKEDVPLSIAVYSKKYDETYVYTNSKDTFYPTASVVKADFLVKFLHQIDEEGREVTDYEENLLEPMIKSSDNDAATAIYRAIGESQGLQQLFEDLNMEDSMPLADGWVFTRTMPKDQLKVLDAIFYDENYLSKSARDYAKELMGNVDEDQRWGVPAGATEAYVKNGWKDMGNGTWLINSIGYLGKEENSCTMAMMSYGHPDLEEGEALLEKLSKATTKILKIN